MHHLTKTLGGLIAAMGLLAVMAACPTTARAQNYPPAILYEDLMNSYFDDSKGQVRLGSYTVAFAPEAPLNAVAAIVDREGKVVASHAAFPDYGIRDGVFAKMNIQGTPTVQLTEPGVYGLVFVIDGKPVTRFPFVLLETGGGDDPFKPEKTYAFDGVWRLFAYFTRETYSGEDVPQLNLWLGGLDMASPDTFQGYFMASLKRDGAEIAHSKRQTSFYSNGHFERRSTLLFEPHDDRGAPNAVPIGMDELTVNGAYTLDVTRAEDGALLRRFEFTVAGGEIQPLDRARLGYDQPLDFIVPRVFKSGSSGYEFEEAIWISTNLQ